MSADCTVIQVIDNDTIVVQDDCDATVIRVTGDTETITIPSDDAAIIIVNTDEIVVSETVETEIIETGQQGPPGLDGAGLPTGKITDILTGIPTPIDNFAEAVSQGGMWHLTVKDQVDDRSFYQQVIFNQDQGIVVFTRGMALHTKLDIAFAVVKASGSITLTATSSETNNLCVSFIRVGTPF